MRPVQHRAAGKPEDFLKRRAPSIAAMTLTIGLSATPRSTWVSALRPVFDVYRATALVTAIGVIVAAAILIQVDGRLAPGPALAIGSLVLVLWSAHLFYRRRRDDRLAAILGGIALIMVAGIAAGAISQAGLALGMPTIDPLLARADAAMGFSAKAVTTFMAASPVATGLLGIAYMSSFPLILASVLLLSFGRRADRAWELCFLFAASILLAGVCSAFFPAIGAFQHLQFGEALIRALPAGSGIYHLEDFYRLRSGAPVVLDLLKAQGVVTFPSFHTMLALMTAYAWRGVARIFPAMIGWNAVVIVSTIPIGGHYGVDLIGGALAWGLLAVASRRIGPSAHPNGAFSAATCQLSTAASATQSR